MANNVVCVKGSTSIRGFHPSHPVVRGQFQPRSGDLGGLSSLPMAPELESQKSNPDDRAGSYRLLQGFPYRLICFLDFIFLKQFVVSIGSSSQSC